MSSEKILLKDVKKKYGDVEVIRQLNLAIEPGEFVVLVGPSGCGKSTILRMIAGLEELTEGQLYINGEEATHTPAKDRNLSMVFQDYALYPHMTVKENMAFSLSLKGESQDVIERQVGKAAKMLSLEKYLDRKPAALSGGQRQRVAMGRAVVKGVDLILYDEPLSNLDAKLRTKMRSEIKRFHHGKESTAIYVTHDQMEAMTLADKLVVLRAGQVEQVGSPLEVFSNPASVFVADFIGNPGMNFFNVSVEREGHRTVIHHQDGGFKMSLPQSKAQLVHP
ncbi:MAG: ATP-binding cassette domain-containing protein, partial [Bdellovibrionales bacterium]|nr:ATP-binding cassette domain-containing protein [Bdellovibrionales bacterium]